MTIRANQELIAVQAELARLRHVLAQVGAVADEARGVIRDQLVRAIGNDCRPTPTPPPPNIVKVMCPLCQQVDDVSVSGLPRIEDGSEVERMPEWVNCSHRRCQFGETRRWALERGWTFNEDTGLWKCPTHKLSEQQVGDKMG